jgi:hypothetical protein
VPAILRRNYWHMKIREIYGGSCATEFTASMLIRQGLWMAGANIKTWLLFCVSPGQVKGKAAAAFRI